MRMASWSWGGATHVGHDLGRRARSDAAGACADAGARRAAADRGAGARRAAAAARRARACRSTRSTLRAPLPRPLRSLFCVGRNYHAHAAELAELGVHATALPTSDAWPIVFTKVPECVVGPHDAVRLPGAASSAQIDYEAELAVVIGRGGRDIARARRDGPRLRLHDRQRRDRARRADAPPAVGPRQELRHLLPDGPVDRHRRRARRPRHARALLGQRRAAPGRPHRAT